MKLLVTEGAGFIGSHFIRRIISGSTELKVESLRVLDCLTYARDKANIEAELKDPRVSFFQQNITKFSEMLPLFEGIDLVIHFAAESHVDRSILDPLTFVKSNVVGTQPILQASRESAVKTVLIVSTDEVYGSIENGNWTEKSPLLPNSPYAASKASSDMLAMAAFKTYGMDVRISRCGNNFGTFQHPEKLISLFITNLIDLRKVPVYGNGQNVRDWIHVDDHCRALETIITNGRPGEIYNIGKGEELTNLQITNLILTTMGIDSSFIAHVDDRMGHDKRYALNCTKIQNDLGLRPLKEIQSEIVTLIQWYRKNISWWEPKKGIRK